MEKREFADGSKLFTSPRGTIRYWVLGKGCAQFTCVGLQEAAFSPIVTSVGQQMVDTHGRCVYMVDSYDSNQMDSGFREQTSKWIMDQRGKVQAHLLQRSKLIVMAVHVANMLASKPFAFAYTNPTEWEAVGKREVGESFRRRSINGP